jgi:phosphoglycerate dehydrogenase-like enzyme
MRTIGIVGAGRIGRELAARFTTAGTALSCRAAADRSPSQGSSRCLARGRKRWNLVRLGCLL